MNESAGLRVRTTLAGLVAAIAGLLALVPSAAHAVYQPVDTFAGPGSGDGQLAAPRAAVVLDSTGNLFVVDSQNDRVQVFAPTDAGGSYLTQFGAGVLDDPVGIAVDQGDGDLYVGDAGNDRIVKFSSNGTAIPSFTLVPGFSSPPQGSGAGAVGAFDGALAFDSVGGDLLVADRANGRISRYDGDTGAHGSSFDGSSSGAAFSGLLGLGVDSSGDVLALDSDTGSIADVVSGVSGSRVVRFAADGSHQHTLPTVPGRAGALAVDTADRVLVGGNFDSYNQDNGPLTVHVFDGDGNAATDFALSMESRWGIVAGLAGDVGRERIYAVTDVDPFDDGSPWGAVGIETFVDVPPPDVALDPVMDVSDTRVRFTGTIDSRGLSTEWRLELSLDGGPWETYRAGSRGDGDDPVPVAVEAADLLPNRQYRARLVATSPAGTTVSAERVFISGVFRPDAITRTPVRVTTTSARLGGVVNPRGSTTTYWVEYGPDTDYGERFPLSGSAAAGGGGDYVDALVTIDRLEPGVTYHYRLVAKNPAGVTAGADRIFTAREPNAGLPDGRVYEMVSPPDKASYDVKTVLSMARAATSGDRVTFSTRGPIPGIHHDGAPYFPRYIASRTAGGWSTKSINVPTLPNYNTAGFLVDAQWEDAGNFSDDLTRNVVAGFLVPLTSDAETERIELYRREDGAPYRRVTKSLVGPIGRDPWVDGETWAPVPYKPGVTASTADLDHIVWESPQNYTPDATGNGVKAYEWDDGDLRLVGILPDGTPAPAGATTGPSQGNQWEGDNGQFTERAMSDDGSRIFFTASPATSDGRLFMRENGGTPDARTVWISQSEKAGPDPGSLPARFRDATPNGTHVFFTTAEQLTDEDVDANVDLYRYDVDAPGPHLTLLSRGSAEIDDPDVRVDGTVGVSDDGTRAYFATVAAGATSEPDIGSSATLYLWDDGALTPVSTVNARGLGGFISGVDRGGAGWAQQIAYRPQTRVSADGRYLLFSSNRDLLGERDPYPTAGITHVPQLYLYDAEADDTVCVSCDPAGTAPNELGKDGFVNGTRESGSPDNRYLPRTLVMRDGQPVVYFTTVNSLVDGDVNGKVDVYRYSYGDRSAALISSGRSTSDSWLLDAGEGGRDVFFVTRERLSEWDQDTNYDVYDARVGGTRFPGPPRVQACSGDACQGAPSNLPELAIPSSGVTRTPARQPRVRAKLRLDRLSMSQIARLAGGRVVAMPVLANGRGKVALIARAQFDGRQRIVARASRAAHASGTTRLRLRLSPAARARLDRGQRLRVSIQVRFAGVVRAMTVSVGRGK